jgi:RHS repeat-associated protein
LQQIGLTEVALHSGNRLSRANGEQFEYNTRNHLSRRQKEKKIIQYEYDADDMLVRVVLEENEWQAQYDPLGRRVWKSFRGQRTEFYWDGDQLAAEIFPDGRVRIYLHVDNLALTPFMFMEYEGLEASPESGKRYFIFSDQIGTPIEVENELGKVVWRARITPYGMAEVEIGESFHMPLRFPGHYFDVETRLHYNRFRYYDPLLGRYLQSDPDGIEGGLNLYGYGEGNPLKNVDIQGLTCITEKKKKRSKLRWKAKKERNKKRRAPKRTRKALKKKGGDLVKIAQEKAIEAKNKGSHQTMISVVRDKKTGEIFVAESGKPRPKIEDLHPELQNRIPKESLEAWPTTNCAEPKACQKAFDARPSAKMKDLEIATVRISTGYAEPRCDNCRRTTHGATVYTDH